MKSQTHDHQNVLLVQADEMSLADEMEVRQRREKTVANARLLWLRRGFIGKVVLFGVAISLALAFLMPPRYESTVKLMPPDQNSGGMLGALSALTSGGGSTESSGGIGALGEIAGNVLGLKTSSDLFIGILQSRTVRDDLINKFNLRKVYWDGRMEDARKDLARKTDISADRKSGIISIVVTDRDPHRAAAMGSEYVNQLNALLIRLNTSAAHRERVFLEERLKEVEKDLESAEHQLSSFSSKNATLDMKEQSVAMVDAAAMLEGQLVAAETELQGVKQVYGDGNVRVRSAQARVDELKKQIQKVGGKATASASSSDQYVDSLYPTIRALPVLGVQYADLYREAKIQETTYGMLTRELEMAKVEEAKELPSVRVLDEPEIPGKRSFPPRILMICFGSIVALGLGAAIVLFSQTWHSIDPQDPAKLLATEVWIEVKGRTHREPRDNRTRSSEPGSEIQKNQIGMGR